VRPTAAANGRDGVPRRTESLDSLIPRSRSKLHGGTAVTKTTTIEVEVCRAPDAAYRSAGKGVDGLAAQTADVVVTGGTRSKPRRPSQGSNPLLDSESHTPSVVSVSRDGRRPPPGSRQGLPDVV